MHYIAAMTATTAKLLPPLLASILLLLGAASSCAAGQLKCPYFPLPALFIETENGIGGYGPEIIQALSAHLPGIAPVLQPASPRRILADAAQGENLLITGLFKTQERQEFLHFTTIPCGLSLPTSIVIRKRDAMKLAPDGVFPVRKALDAQGLRWGFQDGVNHGELEKWLWKRMDDQGVLRQSGQDPVPTLIKMLASKRLDWFPCSPMTADYHIRRLGLEDAIILVPAMEGAKEPNLQYLACPRTPWGKAMAERLDKALAHEVLSGNMLKILIKYIPKHQRPDFLRQYGTYIYSVAQSWKP